MLRDFDPLTVLLRFNAALYTGVISVIHLDFNATMRAIRCRRDRIDLPPKTPKELSSRIGILPLRSASRRRRSPGSDRPRPGDTAARPATRYRGTTPPTCRGRARPMCPRPRCVCVRPRCRPQLIAPTPARASSGRIAANVLPCARAMYSVHTSGRPKRRELGDALGHHREPLVAMEAATSERSSCSRCSAVNEPSPQRPAQTPLVSGCVGVSVRAHSNVRSSSGATTVASLGPRSCAP